MKDLNEVGATGQFPVGVVVSRFNEKITERLLTGAISRLKALDFTEAQITLVRVPGAVEIPLAAQRLAQEGNVEGIVCLGSVIRGETSHYDSVCQMASQGVLQVNLTYNIPVIFGVLTTENSDQALERSGGNKGNKGEEAVNAVVEMHALFKKLGVEEA